MVKAKSSKSSDAGRNWRRTTIVVTVLSEGPIEFDSLADLHHMTIDGDCSGDFTTTKDERLTRKQMAKALEDQGSDPEFLGAGDEEED